MCVIPVCTCMRWLSRPQASGPRRVQASSSRPSWGACPKPQALVGFRPQAPGPRGVHASSPRPSWGSGLKPQALVGCRGLGVGLPWPTFVRGTFCTGGDKGRTQLVAIERITDVCCVQLCTVGGHHSRAQAALACGEYQRVSDSTPGRRQPWHVVSTSGCRAPKPEGGGMTMTA